MPIDYGYEFAPYECAYCGAPVEPGKWENQVSKKVSTVELTPWEYLIFI